MPTPKPSQLKPPDRPAPQANPDARNLLRWLLHLPRYVRIIMCAVFAFAITLGLTPIIDYLYLVFIYQDNTDLERFIHARAPAMIEVGLGLAMYLIGWVFFVGTRGETPPARPVVLWYFGIGLFAVFLVFLWIIQGMASGSAL
jgi:hypothetical protein